MKKDNAITVRNLYKSFKLPHEKHSGIKQNLINIFNTKRGYETQHVLNDISFDIKKGEFFGIVGRNGSGKSTLLKLLAGIYASDSGSVRVDGSLTPFIELGVGFNLELTGKENVFMNGALLGFDRKEIEGMYKDIVDFAELENFMDQKLKNYSSGMQVRLAFSIAIRAKGDILLLDEVLAVGDYDFQQKCFDYFEELKKMRKTVILVSHDMGNIRKFCTRGVHLLEGKIKAYGATNKIISSYMDENEDRALEKNEKQDDLSKRITGLGTVKIEKVYTQNSEGEKTSVFRPDETIEICFQVKSNQDITAPTYGMIFTDNSGKVIFATNSMDKNIDTENKKNGDIILIKYRIKNNFDDGTYIISGAVANYNRTKVFARIDSGHRFKVVGRVVTAKAPYYPDHEIIIS